MHTKSEISREYYICNLAVYPSERAYYINWTNECISKCSDVGLKEYSSIWHNPCSLLTKERKTETINLKDLVGNINEKIVDLHPNLTNSGITINNEEASLQIYG